MKKDKAYYEKQFVEELIKVGVNQYCETYERGNTYYCFWLKAGVQRYWTNMSKENLDKIIENIKAEAQQMLEDLRQAELENFLWLEYLEDQKDFNR